MPNTKLVQELHGPMGQVGAFVLAGQNMLKAYEGLKTLMAEAATAEEARTRAETARLVAETGERESRARLDDLNAKFVAKTNECDALEVALDRLQKKYEAAKTKATAEAEAHKAAEEARIAAELDRVVAAANSRVASVTAEIAALEERKAAADAALAALVAGALKARE